MVSSFIEDGYVTLIFSLGCPLLAWLFSAVYYYQTKQVVIDPNLNDGPERELNVNKYSSESDPDKQAKKIWDVYNVIYEGAHSFLYAEYTYIAYFVVCFSIVIFFVLGATDSWVNAIFTVIAFVVGCATSVLAGFVGMKIGVFANARTAVQCQRSLAEGFVTSFKAAVVMGFCLCAFGIFNLYILLMLFRLYYTDAFPSESNSDEDTTSLCEAIAGYGLGGSSIALFGRVGGGIYTKAADVGADLVGKVEAGLDEDDPRNPAVIADNVGDNVGDIAGMGADLFGSFAESTCAALVIAAQTGDLTNLQGAHESTVWRHFGFVTFPLIISCTGILACFLTSFFASHVFPPQEKKDIEPTLKHQLLISTIIETVFLFLICMFLLPTELEFAGYVQSKVHNGSIIQVTDVLSVKNWYLFFCAASGLWAGLGIGYITEYYTSNQYVPVQGLAVQCETGAATNIIMGLALGYKSVIIPVLAMALATFVSHSLAGFFGVALAALGILSTLSIGLTIDAFGPVCDNAGGIAEMCEMGKETRDFTDALDAAGNTTAAIGKGFAIGSAAFVSLALFSGYMTILQNRDSKKFAHVDILHAFPFAGILVGAMIPYWFSALTMGAVGRAAMEMVREVRRQFAQDRERQVIEQGDNDENEEENEDEDEEKGKKPIESQIKNRNGNGKEENLLSGDFQPDYDTCIMISTKASLKEMIAPGMLVMLTPIVVGFVFGCKALAGVLIGALVSGVCGAVSASNTGGAWDNAKKYIEQGKLPGDGNGKGSDTHKAAVVGDTVGDPLKDTSGPSLNIVMKLMAVESLVFAKAFYIEHPGFVGWIASLF